MTLMLVLAGTTFLSWSAIVALRFRSACFVLLAVALLLLWEFPRTGVTVSVLSTEVHAEDILALFMILVAVVSQASGARRIAAASIFIGGSLVTLLTYGLVVGSLRYGMAGAVNEFRGYFYALASYFYILAMLKGQWRESATHVKTIKIIGVALSLVAAYHIAMNGLGNSDSWVEVGDEYQTGRPLIAAQAMVLTCIGLILLGRWANLESREREDFWFSGVFLLVAVLCQHRSVWGAMAAGLGMLLAYSLARGRMTLLVATALAVYFVAIGAFSGFLGGVLDPVVASFSNTGTYDGRTFSWEALVQKNVSNGWVKILLGDSWGAAWERLNENGEIVDFRPHNTYVSLFLRTGLVGLLAVVFGMLVVAKRLVSRSDDVRLAIFAAIVAYCWAYDIDWHVAAIAAWVSFGSMGRWQYAEIPTQLASTLHTDESQGEALLLRSRCFDERSPRSPWAIHETRVAKYNG